ncbi:MAG: hypothetical protein NW207_12200 [Cytophagales bacterium]|nr:hypothetical protein [Cytophagales bacterium]
MNKILLLASIIIFFAVDSTHSQDSHYWSQNFGARPSLLGGSIVGGDHDNSAVFYTPGAIGFIDNIHLSINANAYQGYVFRVKDGLGQDNDITRSSFNIYPQIIAGLFKIDKFPKWRFGYTLLTRNFFNLSVNDRVRLKANIDNNSNNDYIGVLEYDSFLNEQWAGLCIGHRFNDKFSIGISLFGTYRFQKQKSFSYVRTTTNNDGEHYSFNNYYLSSITDVGSIIKAGLCYFSGGFRWGIAITTPKLFTLGQANVQREISYTNLPSNTLVGADENLLGIDEQRELPAKFKLPFSVSGGFNYEFPWTKLGFSAEYFFAIDPYSVVTARDNKFYTTNSTFAHANGLLMLTSKDYMTIRTQAESVLNFSVGIEQELHDKVDMLLGFHTDYSYLKNADMSSENKANIQLPAHASWDLYHASAGFSIGNNKRDFVLGVIYSFSSGNNVQAWKSYLNPNINNRFEGEPYNNASIDYHSLNFVIGYTHFFDTDQ